MVVLRFEMKSLAESLPVDSNPLFVSHLADIIGFLTGSWDSGQI